MEAIYVQRLCLTPICQGIREGFKRRWRQRRLSYKDIEYLKMELRSIEAALRMVGLVPPDHLPRHLKRWAEESREVSYDIQDILDTFRVRVETELGGLHPADPPPELLSSKIGTQRRTRRELANAISDVKERIQSIAARRAWHADRFAGADVDISLQDVVAAAANPGPGAASADPRRILVGIDELVDNLIPKFIHEDDQVSDQGLKVLFIVGFGGVGKTTLARELYHKVASGFDCSAFVHVSMNPNLKEVFANILRQLNDEKYRDISEESWGEEDLVLQLRQFLQDKKYLIAIDDIWDIESWQRIRSALVDRNLGSRIITTTRRHDVAERVGNYCFKLKPLTYEQSKILFYGIVLGSEGDREQDNQLDETFEKIYRISGGLPLALRTIASVLATKHRNEWFNVINIIASEHDGGSALDITRTLLLSYNYLPSHLKPCFLYLSVFPKGCEFRRDRLVWRWVAEGFIQASQGCSLFETGQAYFEELLTRSMIIQVDKNVSGAMVKYCRVHDLLLDLACSLAREENFVTKLVGEQQPQNSQGKVRRLSFQADGHQLRIQDTRQERRSRTVDMARVRSVSAFGTAIDMVPPLSSFRFTRVLDLEDCDLRSYYDLEGLGGLHHLRYLGLRGTNVDRLPEDIGNLMMLQLLDLKGTAIGQLPPTIVLLRKLLCLNTDQETRMPKGLQNLTSLEELSKVSARESPAEFLKELAGMVELKVLDIVLPQEMSESSQNDFLGSLRSLHKIQSLHVSGCSDLDFMKECWEAVPAPSPLRSFVAVDGSFSVLPAWAAGNAENLLEELHLGVKELRQEDLWRLGRLGRLRVLRLAVDRMLGERLAVDDVDAFPCLTQLSLRAETCLVFRRGAMPKVKVLELDLGVDKINGDFDWGLQNLRSLKNLTVNGRGVNYRASAGDDDALMHAVTVLPNRPSLEITTAHQG